MVTKEQYLEAICKAAHVDDIGDVSDGYHTFNDLYYQRMMLFATIVKQNRDKAWKSLRHEDGELCFGGGWFIVGIDTLEGSYTYHYEDKYFDLFDCETLDHGKHWDGHTEKDVTRLLSLEQESCEDCISREHTLAEFKRVYFDDKVVIRCAELVLGHEPSVNSRKSKTGHWIEHEIEDTLRYLECSNCHYETYNVKHNYCMNCGAKMIEIPESEE